MTVLVWRPGPFPEPLNLPPPLVLSQLRGCFTDESTGWMFVQCSCKGVEREILVLWTYIPHSVLCTRRRQTKIWKQKSSDDSSFVTLRGSLIRLLWWWTHKLHLYPKAQMDCPPKTRVVGQTTSNQYLCMKLDSRCTWVLYQMWAQT